MNYKVSCSCGRRLGNPYKGGGQFEESDLDQVEKRSLGSKSPLISTHYVGRVAICESFHACRGTDSRPKLYSIFSESP